jgi:hypothetical protein
LILIGLVAFGGPILIEKARVYYKVPTVEHPVVEYQTPEDTVRRVVEDFGDVIKNVPLAGTPEIVTLAIRENYSIYLSDELLNQWVRNNNQALGRETSSPWPERIDIESITKNESGDYTVKGEVVSMTSQEMVHGGDAGREAITLTVEPAGQRWVIGAITVQR